MKKIERRLNSAANRMLPAADAKERIRRECFDDRVFAEAEEPALATQTAGGASGHMTHISGGRKFTVIVAFMLLACIMVGAACYFALAKVSVPISDTFLNISINPEFGITADEHDTVTEVVALNEDAAIVLYGMDLVGLNLAEATNLIVAESAALGFLDTSANGSMKILAVNENGKKENDISDALLESLNEMFEDKGWRTSVLNAADGITGANDTGEEYKYSFGRNGATAGKTALAERASEELGSSFEDCIKMSVTAIGDMIAKACEDAVDAVENAMRESFESNDFLKEIYNDWQLKKQEYDTFVSDINRVFELLEQNDGHLSADERETVKELLDHPYLDLGVIADLIEAFWNDLEELYAQMKSLITKAMDSFKEEVCEIGLELAREINSWKAEFIASFTD